MVGVGLALLVVLRRRLRRSAIEGPLKVAFVYVGPIGDAGWTYSHDVGRKALTEKFGDKVQDHDSWKACRKVRKASASSAIWPGAATS